MMMERENGKVRFGGTSGRAWAATLWFPRRFELLIPVGSIHQLKVDLERLVRIDSKGRLVSPQVILRTCADPQNELPAVGIQSGGQRYFNADFPGHVIPQSPECRRFAG